MVAVLLLITPLTPSVLAQRPESIASLLLRFDNEHDLSGKEQLLRTVTGQDAGAGPALLRLAQSTTKHRLSLDGHARNGDSPLHSLCSIS
jgi:hypothetical protein